MGHFWLELENQGHRQRFDFNSGRIAIGREAGSDVLLDHPTVSRQHALIVENYGSYQLVVLSKNGLTAVDGNVVSGTVDLRPGMTIQVGELQLGFRAPIGNAQAVNEYATEAVSLDQLNPNAPTAALPVVEERTEPSRDAWDAPSWNAANAPAQQSFAGNPAGSGFGQMPVQGGFGQSPAGSGFGQMPVQGGFGQSPAGNGFGQMPMQPGAVPAPSPTNGHAAAGPKKGKDEEYGIKSWDEIAAEATGAHGAETGGMTDFERIQKAQAKANKRSGGTSPALLGLMVVAVGGLAALFIFDDPKKVVDDGASTLPDRCAGLKICYPEDKEPTCANKSDCEAKALTAYNVADELYQKKGANITNRYEAYKQLDKAGRFLAKAGLEKPPASMKDYDARLLQYEEELDKIASEHRIRNHQLQQRKMNWEMADNVRAWQAFFPDTYNTWYQEAITAERRMKDAGSWPAKYDKAPEIKKRK